MLPRSEGKGNYVVWTPFKCLRCLIIRGKMMSYGRLSSVYAVSKSVVSNKAALQNLQTNAQGRALPGHIGGLHLSVQHFELHPEGVKERKGKRLKSNLEAC